MAIVPRLAGRGVEFGGDAGFDLDGRGCPVGSRVIWRSEGLGGTGGVGGGGGAESAFLAGSSRVMTRGTFSVLPPHGGFKQIGDALAGAAGRLPRVS